ncbi:hypothetical protein [Pelagerythrobacter marensis]|uniref:Uncharacterized protein n=1 Tax=Pelagerythrobacter marensis TaxID=543877 RepID=A0A0G3XCP2_9SPHN|nr:hypothetical protein [Pelagerythrobacter marensis]AKM08406.1 hypothetical protein AM2010_2350 [Pelagerythrobacter marensis]
MAATLTIFGAFELRALALLRTMAVGGCALALIAAGPFVPALAL